MPIDCPISIRRIEQEEFAQLDFQVMRCAFDAQNELGRLCDEVIYQNDVTDRLRSAGLGPIRKEVPVRVTHRDFAKTYSLDLVVGDAAVYELKAEARLALEHDSQLLNYLFLTGSNHGKLINFRSPKVESRFVNTSLTAEERRQLEFDTERWREPGDAEATFQALLVGLLEDWGGFLEIALYREALIHFLGGEETVSRMAPMNRDGAPLGNQRLQFAQPDTAFRLTALTDEATNYERHLRSLLSHSPLSAILWVNLCRSRIEFVTLRK
jgi:GxxExxY protein